MDVTEPSPHFSGTGDSPAPVDEVRLDNQTAWLDASILLSAWFRRARESQMSHYAAAMRCTSVNRWLGVPSAVFSAAAGTTLFATAQRSNSPTVIQIAAGIVVLAAGTLSALQTFLGLSERAEKHLATGAAYGSLRREIEELQVLRPTRIDDLRSTLTAIRRKLDDISATAPSTPEGVWKKAQRDIEHTNRPEGFTPAYLEKQRHTPK
ncbi:SLATT domain-containing protein [Streptomyces sp. NPDC101169]|uniref:SLATT domain-containing protein n=1 Tax=Streptomyces sp. NPDC101169 TaxID=3366121 RepID=UPI003819C532